MIKLGELVRQKRRESGMTQKELAEKAGITDGYVARIEIGYQKPGVRTIVKIADILQIDRMELFKTAPTLFVDFSIYEKSTTWDKEFSKLHPKVKEILLEIAPTLSKFV